MISPKKATYSILVLLAIYILSPFFTEVGMAALFAVIFYPWMKKFKRERLSDALAAGLLTLFATLLVFLPVSALSIGSVRMALRELKVIKEAIPVGDGSLAAVVSETATRLATFLPVDSEEVTGYLKDGIVHLSSALFDALSGMVSRIPGAMISFSVFIFALYYFLADSSRFLAQLRAHSFFSKAETEKLFLICRDLCRSVILASVVCGALQATLATAVSFGLGIHRSILVFPAVFTASFIPLIGAFPLVIGLAAYLGIQGQVLAAVIMAFAAVFISTVDNFIRPQIIHGGSNLHPLLSFVSALGGLELLGMPGLFLGPVICGLSVALISQSDEKQGRSSTP